jgi:phage gpG-like protein
MLEIRWNIEGQDQLVRRLRGISHNLKDWKPAFQESVDNLKDTFSNDVFETRGRAIGESWAPLSPAYAARKASRYPGKGILEATGKMRRSFQTRATADMGVVWNTAAYFPYHQSNKPRFRLPRRTMMKLGELQKQQIVKIFQGYFRKKISE